MANDTPFGLAAYVFTNDLNRSIEVCEALQFGIIGLNDMTPAIAEGAGVHAVTRIIVRDRGGPDVNVHRSQTGIDRNIVKVCRTPPHFYSGFRMAHI